MIKEFYTTGEVAKRAGVTNRTLQYYDEQGLLSPAKISEGGRRLYSKVEIDKLHQILAMKYLGLTLDEIKLNIKNLTKPSEAIEILQKQVEQLKEEQKKIEESLSSTQSLIDEISTTNKLDWAKYADTLKLLHLHDENYLLINKISDNVYERIKDMKKDDAEEIRLKYQAALQEAGICIANDVKPSDEQAQKLANEFWDMVMDFTKGDMELISELSKLSDEDSKDKDWQQKMDYISDAMDVYFADQKSDET